MQKPSSSEPRFRLLLAGEDAIELKQWTQALEDAGYSAETVTSGASLIHRLRDERMDLIILASDLPDTTAQNALQAIRELYSPTRQQILLITPSGQDKAIIEGFDLGANDCLPRPFDLSVLLRRIQVRFRQRQPLPIKAAQSAVSAKLRGTGELEVELGTVLEGKYRIDSLLGRGHYGAVYRAMHLTLERPVAVKVLHPNTQNRTDALERFRREGTSASKIEHPNAVSVLDYSVTENGLPYLVMELLEGHSLDQEIKNLGRLHPIRCAAILLPVCEVLAEAHSLGIIHRDIKPQNIFIQEHPRRGKTVKVLDFGIAKLVDDAVLGQQELTVDGSGPGTPTYMAPERFSEGPYDGRADVYSLGVTFYEMLTGKPPFQTKTGNPIRMALLHMSQAPPSLRERNPDVPRAVEEVVLSALEKDPEKRPTIEELARSLVKALGVEMSSRG